MVIFKGREEHKRIYKLGYRDVAASKDMKEVYIYFMVGPECKQTIYMTIYSYHTSFLCDTHRI